MILARQFLIPSKFGIRHSAFRFALVVALSSATCGAIRAQDYRPPADPPAGNDWSHPSLRAYQARLNAKIGHYREMPLDEKAEYFEWELWRYHLMEQKQVYSQTELAAAPGVLPTSIPLRDMSTWNGSVMAALSFKYAVTREPETLRRLGELVRGMHFFFQVTEVPGLPCRAIHPTRWPNNDHGEMREYTAPDGRKWYYVPDPAKGGFNQIAGGYAALMMFAAGDLPADVRALAVADYSAMIKHLIVHDWKATDKAGPTSYGDLTPVVGGHGIPFNAQVAYQLVALGHTFPPADEPTAGLFSREFQRLRNKHHCYFEYPFHAVVLPQRVGGSPLVKGMNDRNHVTNAAFIGLLLDYDQKRRRSQPVDGTFTHQLGQTMVHAMEELYDKRNALCTFMWAGLTRDQNVLKHIVDNERNRLNHQMRTAQSLVDGVEQLRRFKLDRWWKVGEAVEVKQMVWNDEFRPDDSIWKVSPFYAFRQTGPELNQHFCAMDYLYAYWLFRYFRLDEHVNLRQSAHARVMRPTPGLKTWPTE